MNTRFGWRMRIPRMNPLASCLAVALTFGAGSAAAGTSPHWTMEQKIGSTVGTGVVASVPSTSIDLALKTAMIERAKATMSRTPPPVPAVSIPVTNCNDDGPGSLRDAFDNAVDGDTIDLTNTGCSQITLTTGSVISSADDLTLQGPGALSLSISGNDQYPPLLHIGAGTLQINDLTVEHGFKYFTDAQTNPAKGGCIYSTGTVALSNSWTKYCSATSSNTTLGVKGGAIYGRNGVALIDSTVSSNTASSTANYAYGGGIYTQGYLTVINSTIFNNLASSATTFGQGGAAEVGSFFGGNVDGDQTIVKYSSITDNVAAGPGGLSLGGGLYTTGNVIMQYSLIADNQANRGAGAIFRTGTNTDYPFSLLNSTISGNHGGGSNGGLLITDGNNARIGNSTITNNTAISGTKYGAGLNVGNSSVEFQSSIISGNTTDTGSGPLPDDIYGGTGASASGANNLVGLSQLTMPGDTLSGDPMLKSLSYNGGNTATHALTPHSPAVDTGNNAAAAVNDQRGAGFPRDIGINVDIGAFELDTDDVIFADGFDVE